MRQPPRAYHTRFGWWVMTHDRGGPAVIGAGATIVLIADLSYSATQWTGSFPRAFLVALAALAALSVLVLALRFIPRIGAGRRATRWNQRGANVVLVLGLVVTLAVNRGAGNEAGWFLGYLAGLAGFFALDMAVWLARKRA